MYFVSIYIFLCRKTQLFVNSLNTTSLHFHLAIWLKDSTSSGLVSFSNFRQGVNRSLLPLFIVTISFCLLQVKSSKVYFQRTMSSVDSRLTDVGYHPLQTFSICGRTQKVELLFSPSVLLFCHLLMASSSALQLAIFLIIQPFTRFLHALTGYTE